MQKQHLFNVNNVQNNTLYLEKSDIQDYISKFFSYDKRMQKKAAFFYYHLIKLKNLKKKSKTKFYIEKNLKKDDLISLKEKKEKNLLLRTKVSQFCKMYSINSTCKYSSYIVLGITTHKDAYKVYKKGKSLYV